MRWTQLESSLLAKAATPLYNASERYYHNLDGHLNRMFTWADHFGFEYDEDLDKAIWSHDAIMDPMGKNEMRSRNWLLAIDPTAQKAGDLVMTTVTHGPSEDNRLVLLDLADFLDEEQTIKNTNLLIKEALAFGAENEQKVYAGMTTYLGGLSARLEVALTQNAYGNDHNLFKAIRLGVDKTLARIALS